MGIKLEQFEFYGYDALTRSNENGYDIVLKLGAVFYRQINSYEIIGNSRITVGFDKDGLYSISLQYSELVPGLKLYMWNTLLIFWKLMFSPVMRFPEQSRAVVRQTHFARLSEPCQANILLIDAL